MSNFYIEKRNGSKVLFDKNKIIKAINSAFIDIDGQIFEEDTTNDIANAIEQDIIKSPVLVSVETIQDWVEDYLMRSERRDVAKAYIRYRYKKEVARKTSTDSNNARPENKRTRI